MKHLVLLFLICTPLVQALTNTIRIGAIFDAGQDRKHQLAFKYGIERVNDDNYILPGRRLVPEIVRVQPDNR